MSTVDTHTRDLTEVQSQMMDDLYGDFPEMGYTLMFNATATEKSGVHEPQAVLDALSGVEVDDFAQLAHCRFSDGLKHGVSKTCRTPLAQVVKVLQAPELLGDELFNLLEMPTRKNDFNKYHFVGLLRLLGHINYKQTELVDDDGEVSLLENIVNGATEFFCSEGARKRTKSIKVVPPTKKPELFKRDWQSALKVADLDELKVMSAALMERQKELSEKADVAFQALALAAEADPVPEEKEEEEEEIEVNLADLVVGNPEIEAIFREVWLKGKVEGQGAKGEMPDLSGKVSELLVLWENQ